MKSLLDTLIEKTDWKYEYTNENDKGDVIEDYGCFIDFKFKNNTFIISTDNGGEYRFKIKDDLKTIQFLDTSDTPIFDFAFKDKNALREGLLDVADDACDHWYDSSRQYEKLELVTKQLDEFLNKKRTK